MARTRRRHCGRASSGGALGRDPQQHFAEEYFEYRLWQPDRRINIDNYLYDNEAARLFKVLNRRVGGRSDRRQASIL